MNRRSRVLQLLVLLFSAPLAAQTGNTPPPVSTVFAVLTESLETKSAADGRGLVRMANFRTMLVEPRESGERV